MSSQRFAGFYRCTLFFKLLINDLVFFIEQSTVSNYAEDNNLFVSEEDKELTKFLLCSDFKIVENWFFESYMVLNPEKCYFMCIGKNVTDSELLHFNDQILRNFREVEMLVITLEQNLNFRSHIKNFCRKVEISRDHEI